MTLEHMSFFSLIRRSTPFLLIVLSFYVWLTPAFSKGPIVFNAEVSSKNWSAARLRKLPKNATIALEITSSRPIVIAIVDTQGYTQYPSTPRPLFIGHTENQLKFSVKIPTSDDYFVILDNRTGKQTASVSVSVVAESPRSRSATDGDKILMTFEKLMHRLFIFQPIKISTDPCDGQQAFQYEQGITLCIEYAENLYNNLKNKKVAVSALTFSILFEFGRELMKQWNLSKAYSRKGADEFASVLMVMLNHEENLRTLAAQIVENPKPFDDLKALVTGDSHPLTIKRAKNILGWLEKPDFARSWQPLLVPKMQTLYLRKLRRSPYPWTELNLVTEELERRQASNPVTPERDNPRVRSEDI